jgi:hypothetical protein
MNKPLDKFGKIIIDNLRDKQIDYFKGLLEDKWKAEELKELQQKLKQFNQEERKILNELIENILTNSIHDFLFSIQENSDLDKGLEILIDNENVVTLSDGLHGEIFGDEGWIQRFSKYKSENEEERSNWAKSMIDKMFGDK